MQTNKYTQITACVQHTAAHSLAWDKKTRADFLVFVSLRPFCAVTQIVLFFCMIFAVMISLVHGFAVCVVG